MAAFSYGVPFGFSAIFAEINNPQAVAYGLATGQNPGWMPYVNPLIWTLYLHTVAAAISTGGFVVASLMALERNANYVRIGLRYGLIFLMFQLVFGLLYWISLGAFSPLLYNAVNGPYLPLFAAKLAVVSALLALGYSTWRAVKSGAVLNYAKWLGPMALFAVVAGEFLNDGARWPNMVLEGNVGIPASQYANFYIEIPMAVVGVILAFLVLSLVVFAAAAYFAIYRRFLAELPEGA